MHRGLSVPVQNTEAATVRESFLVSLRYYRFIWTRWKAEYLRMLQIERKIKGHRQPKVGDIVLLESDGFKLNWSLAIIVEVIPGNVKKNSLSEDPNQK